MATITLTGAWAPNSASNQRMRLRAVIVVPTPAAGATTITVTGTVWLDAGYSFSDSNNTFTHSGSLLGPGSMSRPVNVATNGSQSIYTFSKVVALTDAAQGHTVAFSLSGIEYIPASASVSGTLTIPAKVATSSLLAPSSPTGVTVSRVTDKQFNISYTGTGTSSRRIDGVRIMREGTSSATIGDLPWGTPIGTATGGIADKATKAGGRYRWAVQLYNSAGASAWVYTPWHKTTTTVVASNLRLSRASTQVTGQWTVTFGSAPAWESQQICFQYGDTKAAWTSWQSLTAAARSHTWTPSDPRVRYQVRGVTTEGGTTLYGPAATSPWITALAQPNPPTALGPVEVQLVGSSTLLWRHNAIDGTGQLQYEVRWRSDGGAWTYSAQATSSDASYTATFPAGRIGWQVRTRGSHSTWSDWSTEAQFVSAYRPTMSITGPAAGALDANRLQVSVSYGDAQGAPMAGWRRRLTRDAQVVEEVAGVGAVSQMTFDALLENAATYTAEVWATSGTGLESAAASRTWTTAFTAPRRADLHDAAWIRDQGLVRLSIREAVTEHLLPDPAGNDAALLAERAASSSEGVTAVIGSGAEGRLEVNLDAGTSAIFRWGAPGPVEVWPGMEYRIVCDVDAPPYTTRQWALEYAPEDGAEQVVAGPSEGSSGYFSGVMEWTWTPTQHGWVLPALHVENTYGGGVAAISYVHLTLAAGVGAADHMRIELSTDRGATWGPIADDVPLGSVVYDHRAPLNSTPWWRAVAVSALGVETNGIPVAIDTPSQAVWLNRGNLAVAITYDLDLEHSMGHTVVLEEYLTDAAEQYPTPHYGALRSDSVSVSGRITDDIAEADLAALLGGTVWWRDPLGRSWPATVESQVSVSHSSPRVGSISLTARRVTDDS